MLDWPDREGYWHIIYACGSHNICMSNGKLISIFGSGLVKKENLLERFPEFKGAKFLFMLPLIDSVKHWPDSEGEWKILGGRWDGFTVTLCDGCILSDEFAYDRESYQENYQSVFYKV